MFEDGVKNIGVCPRSRAEIVFFNLRDIMSTTCTVNQVVNGMASILAIEAVQRAYTRRIDGMSGKERPD
jgi:hypothetical protein